ncbi:hypothetical protein [Ruegeria sp. HKCCD8929]|uniref:hypothetical protein n=1 Tax=Ruegeria sp. HKCCD8929 TaxID=2683006 RepID=UPI0014893EF0|nr:hypothetical protein [Ruegeria sp. HKCCD8929]
MAFDNDTNRGRVQKMIYTLDLIRKSANSNRATSAELGDLLKPLTDELTGIAVTAVETARQAKQPAGRCSVSGPQWANVRDMAEQADLKDLTVALAVFMNRIEDELS